MKRFRHLKRLVWINEEMDNVKVADRIHPFGPLNFDLVDHSLEVGNVEVGNPLMVVGRSLHDDPLGFMDLR